MRGLLGGAGKDVINGILPDSPLFDNYSGGVAAITIRSVALRTKMNKEAFCDCNAEKLWRQLAAMV
jgi:hypothetical protein